MKSQKEIRDRLKILSEEPEMSITDFAVAELEWVLEDSEKSNSGYPLLGEIRAMQGYEPDYGETMTTQQDGRWVEKEEVLKIASKYSNVDDWQDTKKELPKACKPVLLYVILDNAEGYPYQIQGYLNLDGWHDCFGETLERDKVLAWQPLNLPPNFNITGG